MKELNDRFGIPGVVTVEAGEGGLPRLAITSRHSQAHIYLHGAHVAHWQPQGAKHPVLFMSGRSSFEAGKPIRGGVPVCWPWFGPRDGDPDAPMHGFARLQPWNIELVTTDPGDRVVVTLALTDTALSRKWWQDAFELRLTVTIGPTLAMALETRNNGTRAFRITEALHTYLLVSDVRQAAVVGIEGAQYISKVEGGQRRKQPDQPVRFTGETDRVYLNSATPCVLNDPGWRRKITVDKSGSGSTVVWNPWIAKAAAMPDFGDDEWPSMVCIETANALENAVTVAPGESHVMRAEIGVREE